MSLKVEGFKSSEIFDILNEVYQNEEVKNKQIKELGAIVVFILTNAKGETQSWYLDLLVNGQCGKGEVAPDVNGAKPEIEILMSDESFIKLILKKSTTASLYLWGKLKLRKGSVLRGKKVAPILFEAVPQEYLKVFENI